MDPFRGRLGGLLRALIVLCVPVAAHGQPVPQALPKAFIAGASQPEDLIRLTGTRWAIASSLRSADGIPGTLSVIDVTSPDRAALALVVTAHTVTVPDGEADATCREPPNPRAFFPHGINVRRIGADRFRLYVVNHGDREAIEIYDAAARDNGLGATWRGCIPMPPHVWPNGVAPLPGGGVIVTNMYDPADRFIEKFAAGVATGGVIRWTPNTGWTTANTAGLSGANGVEVSADGRFAYVSEWAARRLWRVALDDAAPPLSVPLAFLPDNLRWTEAGRLIVAGQNARPESLFGCVEREIPCPSGFTVAEIDPATMETTTLFVGGDSDFGGATVALRVGTEIWVGSFRGNRIARFADPPRR